MARFILMYFLILFLGPAASEAADNTIQKDVRHITTVVIDAGHGGKDFGAAVGNAREKDIVLDISLKLGELIKASNPGIKVIYTRTTDVFVPLIERAKIANKNEADLFISIHVNGTSNTRVQGTETFVLGEHRSSDNLEVVKKENSVILLEEDYKTTYEGYDPNSPESEIMFEFVQDEYLEQSVMFASEIQNQFLRHARRYDRSVKMAGFLVLRQTTMPSVLVELGFISNPTEREYMLSEKGKTDLSVSIYNAFNAYKRKIENKSAFAAYSETEATTGQTQELNATQNNSSKKAVSSIKTETVNSDKGNRVYYSVQIAASKKKIETSPYNFKGEKNIYRLESKEIIRYYSGKFILYEDAVNEKRRIEKKFPESFIVAFEGEKIIPVKKALGKT